MVCPLARVDARHQGFILAAAEQAATANLHMRTCQGQEAGEAREW